MGAVDAVERVTSEREIDPTRMPFASKVLGRNDSDYADQERFYDTRQLIINARKEREDARGQERIAVDQANNISTGCTSQCWLQRSSCVSREIEEIRG